MHRTPTPLRHLAAPTLAIALLLAACAPAASPASPGSDPAAGAAAAAARTAPTVQPLAPAAAGGREPVRLIQVLPSLDFGYLPSLVAADKGFFAQEGLEVDLRQMPSNAAIPAMTNKEIHLASAGSAARAAYQGAPLRGILYQYHRNIAFAVGAPDVKSYRDLRGKAVAVANVGGSDDWIAKRFVQREGIPLSEVDIVALGQAPQRLQGMLAGQIHFSIMNPDVALELERSGFNLLDPVGEIMPVPWSGFAAHADLIRDQPDDLKAWARAMIRALQFTKRNPAEAADVGVRLLNVNPDVARRAAELLGPSIGDDDPGGFTEASLILLTQFDLESMGTTGDPAEMGKRAHDVTLLRQAQRDLGIRCTTGYQCQ
jgi:NitT/TauT family transport system substrate-binding protein